VLIEDLTQNTSFEVKLSLNDNMFLSELKNPTRFVDLDPFTFLNSLTYATDCNHMCHIADLAYNQAYYDFLFEILGSTNIFSLYKEKVNADITHHNLLNSCLFVVKDIERFITGVRSKGYNINGGPQK